jgi:hypothetical protein
VYRNVLTPNKVCSSSLQDVHLRTIDLALAWFEIPALQLELVNSIELVRSHCRTYAATRCNANHSRISRHDLRGARPRVTQKTCQLLGARVCHCFLELYLVRVMIETDLHAPIQPGPCGLQFNCMAKGACHVYTQLRPLHGGSTMPGRTIGNILQPILVIQYRTIILIMGANKLLQTTGYDSHAHFRSDRLNFPSILASISDHSAIPI